CSTRSARGRSVTNFRKSTVASEALLNVLMKGSSKMKKFMFLFLILCIGLAVSPTMAQDLSTTGSIRGKVIDSNGAAVPGATVTIEGGIGQRSTIANSDGVFE